VTAAARAFAPRALRFLATVPEERAMKRALLPACLLLGLAACTQSSAAEKLIGTYAVDKDATVTASLEMSRKQDPKASNAAIETMVGMLSMSMDVKADGTLVRHVAGEDANGTWKQEGDKFTVTTKKGNKDDVRTGIVDGDKIRFTETEGPKPMTIVLAKKK
jgi:hypothetical protein